MIEINIAANLIQNYPTVRIVIFTAHTQDFMRALEARQGFRELSADLHDLHNWRNQKAEKERIRKELADSQHSRSILARAYVHDHGSDHAQQQTGGEAHD